MKKKNPLNFSGIFPLFKYLISVTIPSFLKNHLIIDGSSVDPECNSDFIFDGEFTLHFMKKENSLWFCFNPKQCTTRLSFFFLLYFHHSLEFLLKPY